MEEVSERGPACLEWIHGTWKHTHTNVECKHRSFHYV